MSLHQVFDPFECLTCVYGSISPSIHSSFHAATNHSLNWSINQSVRYLKIFELPLM